MESLLGWSLIASAALVLGHRVYRATKGGPMTDVWGGAALAVLLIVGALLVWTDNDWVRWPALLYGALFGVIVMPVWVLGVLLPARPTALDYAFTGLYWSSLIAIVVAALAA